MRTNTRELEQMLPVDVHVQTKALGLQGCVPFSPLVVRFDSLTLSRSIKKFLGQNSDHAHGGGSECRALGVWY
jgi:hypothetical protein